MRKLRFTFRDRRLFVRLFGPDVYAVGGYVRDLLRRVPSPPDVDILVARRPLEEIVRRLSPHGRVGLVGRSFGVVKFTRGGQTYDVALPRREAPTGGRVKGHKDFLIAADPDLPLAKDLERRDFRCNSIALRLSDGALVDPLDGAGDIRKKVIRLTNPRAFPDDPLRVLRAARFASVLSYRIDPAVYEAARSVRLRGLSAERVNEELFKLLLDSPRPSVGLEELFRLGALKELFPELEALTLVIQDAVFHPETDAFGHHTVWAHTEIAVDQAKRLAGSAGLAPPPTLALLLAALFHDLGKAGTTHWDFKRGRMSVTSNGHDLRSERLVRKVFDRCKIFSWNGYDLRQIVPLLIRTHHRAGELWSNRASVTRKAFSRLAAEVKGEIELLILLDAADRSGRRVRPVRGLDREARWLRTKFDELGVSRETIQPLLLGRDLIGLGVPPGPEMGGLLKSLYQQQLDSVFQTRAGALRAARRLVKGETR